MHRRELRIPEVAAPASADPSLQTLRSGAGAATVCRTRAAGLQKLHSGSGRNADRGGHSEESVLYFTMADKNPSKEGGVSLKRDVRESDNNHCHLSV